MRYLLIAMFSAAILYGSTYQQFHGFSLLLPLSVIGGWLDARYRYHHVPAVVVATEPRA
jgi:hypothetical protein